jgi:hypothetical protein
MEQRIERLPASLVSLDESALDQFVSEGCA